MVIKRATISIVTGIALLIGAGLLWRTPIGHRVRAQSSPPIMCPTGQWVAGSYSNIGAVCSVPGTPAPVTYVNAAGTQIFPKCYKGFVTSTTAGLWSVSYASLGTTLIYANASALSTSNATGTGINNANISAASLTAASGNVMTQSPLTILTINLFSPVLQTTPTTIWVEACAV